MKMEERGHERPRSQKNCNGLNGQRDREQQQQQQQKNIMFTHDQKQKTKNQPMPMRIWAEYTLWF